MIFTYKNINYNDEEYLNFCKKNGIYDSYLDFILSCQDYSVPVFIKLRQTDFDINPISRVMGLNNGGTLRICNPGCFEIVEEITFDFNKYDDFAPTLNQENIKIDKNKFNKNIQQKFIYPTWQVHRGAYDLGFFAGITVESDNVYIFSNNKVIKQSKMFQFVQRFFACICLGSTPFIAKTGPGNFGSNHFYPKQVLISDINFGKSSHYGILGNEINNIEIRNCNFNNWEVAGLSFNNIKNTVIFNCNIKNNSKNIPVKGNFAAFVFAKRAFKKLSNKFPNDLVLKRYEEDFNKKYREIVKQYEETNIVSDKEFKNSSGLSDCIIYGITITEKGPSIGGIGICNKCTIDKGEQSRNILIINCKISGVCTNPVQVNGLYNLISNKPIVLNNGRLLTTPFGEMEGKLIKFFASYKEIPTEYKMGFNPTSLNSELARQLLNFNKYPEKFVRYCNSDIMNHLLKPVMCIRLQHVKDIEINNLVINNIGNSGYNFELIGHKNNETEFDKYQGCDIIGICDVNSSLILNKCLIKNLKSKYGKCNNLLSF